MKHNFLIGAMMLVFCFAVSNVYAQLEVESTNNVKIGRCMSIATTADFHTLLNLSRSSDDQNNIWYGIKSHMKTKSSVPTGPIISIYG